MSVYNSQPLQQQKGSSNKDGASQSKKGSKADIDMPFPTGIRYCLVPVQGIATRRRV